MTKTATATASILPAQTAKRGVESKMAASVNVTPSILPTVRSTEARWSMMAQVLAVLVAVRLAPIGAIPGRLRDVFLLHVGATCLPTRKIVIAIVTKDTRISVETTVTKTALKHMQMEFVKMIIGLAAARQTNNSAPAMTSVTISALRPS